MIKIIFNCSEQIGDSTNAGFLVSLGIANFDVCIVAIGNNFQGSLETTSLLKELGAKLVVSRAARDVQAKFLLPENWIGRTIGQIDIRKKYNINIIGIRKNGELDMSLTSETILERASAMLVLGRYKELQKCFRI